MRYNKAVKKRSLYDCLLITAQWLLYYAKYQSYGIISRTQYLLCFFFIFHEKVSTNLKKL